MLHDRLLAARANVIPCRGHEYVRRRGGSGFNGFDFGHGHVYDRCDNLLGGFPGCYDTDFFISAWQNPDEVRPRTAR